MAPGVSDSTGSLTESDQAKIRRQIAGIQRKFPQVILQVVMRSLPAAHPFSLYAFWLFNAGAFAGQSQRGKNNRVILLVVDPTRKESALMPGYALESLLPPEALDHLLDLASPAFEDGSWVQGIENVLSGLGKLLATIAVPQSALSAGQEY